MGRTVSELMSQNISNAIINEQTWGGIIYNVKSYGAKGDGITDDSAYINRALAAIPTTGGTLFFPPGVYVIGSASDSLGTADQPRISISASNITIQGYQATIKNGVNKGVSTFKIMGSNINVFGITFDGNNTSINTVHVGYTASNVTFFQCVFTKSKQQTGDTVAATGLIVSAGASHVYVMHSEINTIDSAAATGIARGIWAGGYDAGGNTTYQNVHISNSLFTDITPVADGDAIVFQTASGDATLNVHSSVTDCRFYRCSKRAIKLQASGIEIRGIFAQMLPLASQMYSIISVYANDVIISDVLTDGEFCGIGIEIGAAGDSTFGKRVSIRNFKFYPTVQDFSRGIDVRGNTVEDIGIVGCTIKNVRDGIFFASKGNRAVVNANLVTDCTKSAIINNGVSSTYMDQMSVVGNSTARITEYIVRNEGGEGFVNAGNTSDLSGFGSFGNSIARNVEVGNIIFGCPVITHGSTTPSNGTWIIGDKIINTGVTSGGFAEWECTTSGTQGTLSGVTGSINSGSSSLTVNTVTGLKVGNFITIVGVSGVKQIITIVGLVVTVNSNANATVSGAAVAYSAAVFKTANAVS